MPGQDIGTAHIGLVGLAVMGRNLALNMADHGFRVAVYNRTAARMHSFVSENPDTPGSLVGCATFKELVHSVRRPRKILLMVKAGAPVDGVIQQLLLLLDEGDVIIDGGNSLWTHTVQRERKLAARGIHFVGCGISGGEEGARFGPALMPGGTKTAWKEIKPIWTAIAAKVHPTTGRPIGGARPGKPVEGGAPCTAYIGPDGSGHYVKMVHNGIEYGDMQLICEAYSILEKLSGLRPDKLSEVFAEWNRGELDSFLIEITSDILQQRDPLNRRRWLADSVLDTAGQKGTGKWTSMSALDMGVAVPTIAEAVFARFISAIKEERVEASKHLRGPRFKYRGSKHGLINAVRDALYLSKICSYAQGFALMSAAQKSNVWKLDFGEIARIWRGGCIIRARFLHKITEAYARDRRLSNLLLDPYFKRKIHTGQANWRKVVALAVQAGIPCPAFMAALGYYDSYRSGRLPANLLQAQRDYFGAHGFERVDKRRGQLFHIDWTHPDRPQTKK